jgi:hypothetical protein
MMARYQRLLPAELYLRGRVLVGEWAADRDRLLDALEADGRLVLHRAHAIPLDGGPPEALSTVIVPATDVLLAVPPGPHIRPAPAALWQPRRRVFARAEVGPFTLLGTFHLEPRDTPARPPFVEGRTFLAVTEAIVSWRDEAGETGGEAQPLVLVAGAAIDAWSPAASAPR